VQCAGLTFADHHHLVVLLCERSSSKLKRPLWIFRLGQESCFQNRPQSDRPHSTALIIGDCQLRKPCKSREQEKEKLRDDEELEAKIANTGGCTTSVDDPWVLRDDDSSWTCGCRSVCHGQWRGPSRRWWRDNYCKRCYSHCFQ